MRTPEKAAKAKAFQEARKTGADVPGLNDWNIRWVGSEGYKGIVARQLKEFKEKRRKLAERNKEPTS